MRKGDGTPDSADLDDDEVSLDEGGGGDSPVGQVDGVDFAAVDLPDHFAGGGIEAMEVVGKHGDEIDLSHAGARRDIGDANANTIAVRLRGHIERHDSLDARRPESGQARAGTSGDVRIHSLSADVLSDLVDDQDVDSRERQPADGLLGDLQQFFLSYENSVFGDDLDMHELVESILQNGEAEQDG